MFGHDDSNQTVMGSPTVQNPSMLDNVSSQDFQQDDSGAQQPAPQQDTATPTSPAPATSTSPTNDTPVPPYEEKAEPEHPITTDNPFAKDPISVPADATTTSPTPAQTTDVSSSDVPRPTQMPAPNTDDSTQVASSSPSDPVSPPVVVQDDSADDTQDNSSYLAALSADDDAKTTEQPVDHEKLADMKQQALAHLEPLADHINGTPEETFKTTMMMIQANDNHTLLEKALEAAKKIEDGKIRAQAMLDIINEINYFSQTSQVS